MAFKRSAVRSRLSPPRPEIFGFQVFFYHGVVSSKRSKSFRPPAVEGTAVRESLGLHHGLIFEEIFPDALKDRGEGRVGLAQILKFVQVLYSGLLYFQA